MADDNSCSSETVVIDKPSSSRKRPLSDNNNDDDYYDTDKKIPFKIESNEFFDYSSLKDTDSTDTNYQPIRFSVNQEDTLIEHLNKHIHYYGIRTSPTKARLYRKLRLRQRKRQLGFKIFDIDEHYKTCIRPIKHYKAEEDFDNPVPVLVVNTIGKADVGVANPIVGRANNIVGGADPTITDRTDSSHKAKNSIYDARMIERAMSIQSRLSLPLMPVLLVKGIFNNTNTTVMPIVKTFTSSYTSRLLKPVIFQSYDFTPTKLKVLTELTNRVSSRQNTVSPSNTINPYIPHPITFCYFGEHHLASVNALISYFFWPVNLKEYLQYPDFTVIVQYGKLVIGCGFMTPDVKVSEAYIPFLLVHPDFCGCGLGKVMLYHLIQSCQGKDVTLHVSIDNPAMLLYQQFGFKAEQFCIDFYNKYYPPSYSLSKHAFLMRLRR